MKIHEYQAKDLFSRFEIPVPKGSVAENADQAAKIAQDIGGDRWVIKAQVHAGGRGKGGGVRVAETPDQVSREAAGILGMNLVTHQTGPEGKLVRKLLIERGMYYPNDEGEVDVKEYYMSILLNRKTGKNIIMY